ncbi:Ig-like domain-containing protein [Pontibacter russatus]|uniref:Ig-like domain-containing protein n=1 Tax=Pontibacter russatus TaxID=2694929 RepID=UPI00137B01FE|nr:gliding motility-associated C-terminal domain-containing protein [Pontibacter russatus]
MKPTITANGPITLCAGGSVLLTASPGKSYKWSNGSTAQAITVTRSGVYGVEVTDASGCIGKADDVTVTVAGRLAAPTIVYSGTLLVCQKGSVQMSVPAQEGAAYVWKRDGVLVYDGSNEYVAREAGVYTVELSNFCGAVRSTNRVELKIQEPMPAFEVVATGSTVFCRGGSVRLSVPEYKETTYAWHRDGTLVSGNKHFFVAEEPGIYTAEITNQCGTFRSSKGQQVKVLALPTQPTVQGAAACAKAAVTLTASGGSPGMYRWYQAASGGAAIAGADAASFTTPELSASATYYVAITNGQCESKRVPVKATINTKPAAPEIEADGRLEVCEGGAVMLHTAAIQNVTYTWLRDGQELSGGSNTLQATESGEYSLRVQNECGTSLSSNKVTVRVWPAPAAPAAQDGSSCGPGSVTLTATGGAAGEYRWYESETAPTPLAGSTDGTFTTPALQDSRTYYVALVKNGCEGERTPVQALVYPVPEAVASLPDQDIDSGESVRLNGSGGESYIWSPAAGLDDPLAASPVATPEQTTRYTLTVKNREGCEDTTSVVVTVRQLLVIPNAFSPNGDGVNDNWEIENIEYFPGVAVEVYNRWGNLIFERANYQSDWNGTYRGAALPVGTYFYVISIPGKSRFTGYLNIVN